MLSGGERARLGMAKLMLSSHNFLLLDEPTNHMDIRSKDILKEALKAFDGTLLIVSHDRDFLDGLIDKFYEFNDGRVHEHLETLAEYLANKKLETLHELDRKVESLPMATSESQPDKAAATLSYQEQKELSRQKRRIADRIRYLEHEIAKDEAAMKEIESVLASPSPDIDIMDKTREYLELKRDLDAKTEEWFSLQ